MSFSSTGLLTSSYSRTLNGFSLCFLGGDFDWVRGVRVFCAGLLVLGLFCGLLWCSFLHLSPYRQGPLGKYSHTFLFALLLRMSLMAFWAFCASSCGALIWIVELLPSFEMDILALWVSWSFLTVVPCFPTMCFTSSGVVLMLIVLMSGFGGFLVVVSGVLDVDGGGDGGVVVVVVVAASSSFCLRIICPCSFRWKPSFSRISSYGCIL